MIIIESKTIGEAWKRSIDLIRNNGIEISDEDQELLEISHLFLEISDPDENDPVASSQDNTMRDWMNDNFNTIKKLPELNNSWSYGWRLYDFEGVNQINWVIDKLKRKPESKSATISLLQKPGLESYIPCVSLLDFKIRENTLYLTATCRSLDFGKKSIHNFTNLAAIAKKLAESLTLKKIKLFVQVNSAHIYKTDLKSIGV